jgi:branched-chain amino acid transport system ATP-binding protein
MLEISGVTAGYGRTTVLRDVTINVPDASVVALLGPNGAGKTTVLRAASGLVPVREGRLVLDGEDVTGQTTAGLARRGICHIPEGRGIFPSLTVRENLVLHSPKGREAESVERAIEVVPLLGERLTQTAGSLSGGQQQMLAVVRAYLVEPRAVLVDEASIGLAPAMVEVVFSFLRQLARSGTSLLIVEQYVAKALELAETVYLLNRGRIVHVGPAADLTADEIFERYLGIEVGG